MRLAERTDYALRVLMVLAASGSRLGVPALSEALDVSAHHLSKIVQSLHAAGWVRTTPGRGGGIDLAVDPAALSVGEVVRLIEPDTHLVACMRGPGTCPLERPCRLVHALGNAGEAFLRELDAVTLDDLTRRRSSQIVTAVGLSAR